MIMHNNKSMENLVKNQLYTIGGISDPILNAFYTTDRKHFVTDDLGRVMAYSDQKIEIQKGRYLLPIALLSRMITIADVKQSDKVLDIDSATGYSTVILAKLSKAVYATESSESLSSIARKNLKAYDIDNAILINLEAIGKDIKYGHETDAPYDLIFINSIMQELPKPICEQLNADNGRAVVLNQESNGMIYITLYHKTHHGISKKNIEEVLTEVI